MVTYAYGCRTISDKTLKTKKEWYGDNRKFWREKRQEVRAPTIEYFRRILLGAHDFGLCEWCYDFMTEGPQLTKNNLIYHANEPGINCSVCVLLEDNKALLVYSCGQWTDDDGPWRKIIIDTLKELENKIKMERKAELKAADILRNDTEKEHKKLIEQARKLFEVK